MKGILFNEQVIKDIAIEIRKQSENETGGILLGTRKNNIFNIRKITGPGPKAIHQPIFFKADPDYIRMMIEVEHGNSKGEIVYLGEWHTHPEKDPVPSELDLQSLEEISDSWTEPVLLSIFGSIDFTEEKLKKRINCRGIHIYKHPDFQKFQLLKALVE